MIDNGTLPVYTDNSGGAAVSTVVRLAAIPEEDVWLAKQKSARTCRAYRARTR
jgi:hypothetical protein